MPALRTKSPAPTVVTSEVNLPPKFPELPDDVLKRFPSLETWEEDTGYWWTRAYQAIQDTNHDVSDSVTQGIQTSENLTISINGNTAAIIVEKNARIAADGILAQRIVTVSALAGKASNIKVQGTPPGGPAVGDLWVDNSSPLTPVTYQWSGAAWVEVTTPISVAAVAAEQTARITADGYLEGKYTITVIAGNVVTGMNVTSASGPGTDISSVIFRATDFQIYNGVVGKTMFSVSGTDVNLAGTLTVSTSGKVYIGTGTYGNTNTAWYVDSSGNFSLKDKLTWDGTTLTITGSISATTGTIGGWTVGATTISSNNAVLDSAGQLALGTSNNIIILSATDGTYRMWAGNATAGSATFSVTKAGALFSTSGTIGGFTISTSQLYAGSGSTGIVLDAGAAPFVIIGDGTNGPAVLHNVTGITGINSSNQPTFSLVTGSGNGQLELYNAGTLRTLITSTGSSIYGNSTIVGSLTVADGVVGTPGLNFASDNTTGWYLNGAGDMRAATSGTLRFVIRDAAIVCLVPLKLDNAAANITTETLTKYVTMQDNSGGTIKVGVVV